MTAVDVSIIIPAYNSEKFLESCIVSLINTVNVNNIEILVQDDNSPNVILLGEDYPFVSVERNERTLGFGGNCNAGARRAKGKYLFFLNQDCEAVSVGWLDSMLDIFQQQPSVGLVGPKLMFPPGHAGEGRIQSCGGWFDVNKGPFHKYLGVLEDHPLVNVTEEVSWLTGAAIMILKSDFEKLGGFDESYGRGYFEDVDLCLRIVSELNKCMMYCAEVTFYHVVGSAWSGDGEQFKRNALKFKARWAATIESDVLDQKVKFW